MSKIPQLSGTWISMSLGCDPEFFFTDAKGDVVGAEEVLGGPNAKHTGTYRHDGGVVAKNNSVFVDGVQAEFNMQPATCREVLSSEIQSCMISTANILRKFHGEYKMDLVHGTVPITKKKLDFLSVKAREFGCKSSSNVYDKYATIGVDPKNYLFRSAGGHIHFGGMSGYKPDHYFNRSFYKTPDKTVMFLDYILGNTMVIVDRDPLQAERRKNYGRAGEYRSPKHGLEYRTLGNAWLRSYPLMSMAFSMGRFAVNVAIFNEFLNHEGKEQHKLPEDFILSRLIERAPIVDVQRAINTNDDKLAWKNLRAILPVLRELVPNQQEHILYLGMMNLFEHFVNRGVDYWFPGDPLKNWCDLWSRLERTPVPRYITHAYGVNDFFSNVVYHDMISKDQSHWHDTLKGTKEAALYTFGA